MNISTTPSSAPETAADRATDAALAKATAKLAADRKAGADAKIVRNDQIAVTRATKAAGQADDPVQGSSTQTPAAAAAKTSGVDIAA